jgi:hypothetical protein
MIKSALLLLGSPKGEKGSSASLGNYLGEKLRAGGVAVETAAAYRLAADRAALAAKFGNADLVLVSFPVYWDTLPSGLTEVFLALMEPGAKPDDRKRYLAAVCNCGFPDSSNCLGALRAVELFGQKMGMEFLGGVAIGMGGVLGQGKLEDIGLFRKNLPRLDRVAAHLAKGERVPPDVMEALGKPIAPAFLYMMLGNMNFNKIAKKNGARHRMDARPYAATK